MKKCEHKSKMWGYLPNKNSPSASYTREAYFCKECGEVFRTRAATSCGIRKEELEKETRYKKEIDEQFGKKKSDELLEMA